MRKVTLLVSAWLPMNVTLENLTSQFGQVHDLSNVKTVIVATRM